MYSRIKNTQILIALLKKHGIKHIVLSAGQSNYSIVHSVETDSFFKCYSVVDERSAAFFAIGLAQQLNEPVAISCTASTACNNYLSAVTEAYYQGIPLLVLTSSRDIRNIDQLELLMIHQENVFRDVTRFEVQLPKVCDRRDFRQCERMVNEALLELDHRGKGPVHIDVPSYGEPLITDVEELPIVNAIYRHYVDELASFRETLKKKNKIMLVCGQLKYDEKTQEQIDLFSKKYNCVVACEQMANLNQVEKTINMNPVFSRLGNPAPVLIPEVVITAGRHIMDLSWNKLRHKGVIHWYVDESGKPVDPIEALTDVFECSLYEFLRYMNEEECSNNNEFYNNWKNAKENIVIPQEVPLCHIFAIENLIKKLPEEGIIHYSIFNSIRIAQYFDLPKGFTSYANLGALGIDGCLSTFLGQSTATDKEAFLIIGDLSFFYDMNAMRIRHIKNNVHILLLNNSGGAEFYQNNGWYKEIDLHTAAKHSQKAQGWAEECGFEYLSASSKEEYLDKVEYFAAKHDKPIILEVFTNLNDDMYAMNELHHNNGDKSFGSYVMKSTIKGAARNILGSKGVNTIKKIIGRD